MLHTPSVLPYEVEMTTDCKALGIPKAGLAVTQIQGCSLPQVALPDHSSDNVAFETSSVKQFNAKGYVIQRLNAAFHCNHFPVSILGSYCSEEPSWNPNSYALLRKS